jgi:hypothetical protein
VAGGKCGQGKMVSGSLTSGLSWEGGWRCSVTSMAAACIAGGRECMTVCAKKNGAVWRGVTGGRVEVAGVFQNRWVSFSRIITR